MIRGVGGQWVVRGSGVSVFNSPFSISIYQNNFVLSIMNLCYMSICDHTSYCGEYRHQDWSVCGLVVKLAIITQLKCYSADSLSRPIHCVLRVSQIYIRRAHVGHETVHVVSQ